MEARDGLLARRLEIGMSPAYSQRMTTLAKLATKKTISAQREIGRIAQQMVNEDLRDHTAADHMTLRREILDAAERGLSGLQWKGPSSLRAASQQLRDEYFYRLHQDLVDEGFSVNQLLCSLEHGLYISWENKEEEKE